MCGEGLALRLGAKGDSVESPGASLAATAGAAAPAAEIRPTPSALPADEASDAELRIGSGCRLVGGPQCRV